MLLYINKFIIGFDSIILINLNFIELRKLIILKYHLYTTKLTN